MRPRKRLQARPNRVVEDRLDMISCERRILLEIIDTADEEVSVSKKVGKKYLKRSKQEMEKINKFVDWERHDRNIFFKSKIDVSHTSNGHYKAYFFQF